MKILTTLLFETNAKELAVKLATISGLANDRTKPSNEQNPAVSMAAPSEMKATILPGHYEFGLLACDRLLFTNLIIEECRLSRSQAWNNLAGRRGESSRFPFGRPAAQL